MFNLRRPPHLAVIFGLWAGLAQAQELLEFKEEMSRDFPLKRTETLSVSNRHGKISLKAWSQDRVRVVILKTVKAETEPEAKALFPTFTVQMRETKTGAEVATQAGAGLALSQSVKARKVPQGSVDIEVFAPARLPLKIWGVDAPVHVQTWDADLEIRTQSGDIHVAGAKGSLTSVVCTDCRVDVSGVRGDLRIVAGSKPVVVTDLQGKSLYAETRAGPITVAKAQAKDQILSTSSGGILLQDVSGDIHFRTLSGLVKGERLRGRADGQTQDSAIALNFDDWSTREQALLESMSGNIEVSLPFDVSVDLNVKSGGAPATVEFPLRSPDKRVTSGGRTVGRIRDGGAELRVQSDRGVVRIRSAARLRPEGGRQ